MASYKNLIEKAKSNIEEAARFHSTGDLAGAIDLQRQATWLEATLLERSCDVMHQFRVLELAR